MTPTTVAVEPGHLDALAATMRAADVAELAKVGLSPIAALESSLARSQEAWTVLFDGEVAAIYGVSRSDAAIPDRVWCLTSTVVNRAPLTFWRESKAAVARLGARYPTLVALVDAQYGAALRWAHRLGFKARSTLDLRGSPFIAVWRSEWESR